MISLQSQLQNNQQQQQQQQQQALAVNAGLGAASGFSAVSYGADRDVKPEPSFKVHNSRQGSF